MAQVVLFGLQRCDCVQQSLGECIRKMHGSVICLLYVECNRTVLYFESNVEQELLLAFQQRAKQDWNCSWSRTLYGIEIDHEKARNIVVRVELHEHRFQSGPRSFLQRINQVFVDLFLCQTE